jgi:hypothetical protein
MISIEWADFKSVLTQKLMYPQFIETATKVYLEYIEGSFTASCVIDKDLQKDDLADFDLNYRPYSNKPVILSTLPFGAKILPNGKKLFRRVHGISAVVQNAPDSITYTITYPACKIMGVQIINGKVGDTANFKVLDTATGTITGVPNLLLNQFGFNVNIVPEVATYPSKYDADLIQGMQLLIEYDAIDELLPRTVYINFDLHEVKD